MNHAVNQARTLSGLFVVLAMIVAAGWLPHRLQQRAGMGPAGLGRCRSQVITVVTRQMLGTRERAVAVGVEGTWLALGVMQQHVQALHALPRLTEAISAPDGPSGDGTPGSGKPPCLVDAPSIQLKHHLIGKPE